MPRDADTDLNIEIDADITTLCLRLPRLPAFTTGHSS